MKGLELKEMLVAKGVKMSELAASLGISPTTLFNKFNAKNMKPEFIKRVEEIVGFSIDEAYREQASISPDTKELISMLRHKDEQIDRLIALLEKRFEELPSKKSAG